MACFSTSLLCLAVLVIIIYFNTIDFFTLAIWYRLFLLSKRIFYYIIDKSSELLKSREKNTSSENYVFRPQFEKLWISNRGGALLSSMIIATGNRYFLPFSTLSCRSILRALSSANNGTNIMCLYVRMYVE